MAVLTVEEAKTLVLLARVAPMRPAAARAVTLVLEAPALEILSQATRAIVLSLATARKIGAAQALEAIVQEWYQLTDERTRAVAYG